MTSHGSRESRVVLLFGATGQIGWELQQLGRELGYVVVPDRSKVSLDRPDTIRSTIRSLRPQVVINAAAYTAVDRAEQEPDVAKSVNAVAPGVMAEEVKRIGAMLLHYSTDYVFDGTQDVPYTESVPTNPINVYGRTKRDGELAIAATGCSHVILRTSWVYSARGDNFMNTILRLAREREELRVVSDQRGAPTSSRAIARATVDLLSLPEDGHQYRLGRENGGVYHATAAGETSWFEFASAILARDTRGTRNAHASARLVPIPADEYPTPARRPRYSVLNNSRLAATFGIALPTWQSQLDSVFSDSYPTGAPSAF